MATFSNLGIELIADGDASTTWGGISNDNFEFFDAAIAGAVSIPLTGATEALTLVDAVTSNARKMYITFTGTPGETCVVTISPNTLQKLYFFQNDTNQTVNIYQGSGGDVDILTGNAAVVHCDGAGSGAEVVDITENFVSYTHPTHNGDDISIATTALTGATIFDDIDLVVTTDTLGHVTAASAAVNTRELTASDIGAQASGTGTDTDLNTSGAQVVDVVSLTDGIITTAITTRNLTASDISAEPDTHSSDTTTHGATGAVVGTTNTQTLEGKTLDDAIFTGSIDEQVYNLSTGTAISPANGTIQYTTLTAVRTLTLGTFNEGESVTLMFLNTTIYTITWPTITWHGTGGATTAPDLTGNDTIELWKIGTTVHGASAGGVG